MLLTQQHKRRKAFLLCPLDGHGAFPITKRQGFIVETVGKWTMVVGSSVALFFSVGGRVYWGRCRCLSRWADRVCGSSHDRHDQEQYGIAGIARKVRIIATVAVGHLVEGILCNGHMFRDAVAFF